MSKGLRMEVEGVLYYPYLKEKHPKSGKFQVKLGQLDEATAKRLKDYGASVTQDDESGFAITLKNSMDIAVVDAQANELSMDTRGRIGKGTTALVKLAIIPTTKGNPVQGLEEIQILKLVEYGTKKPTTFKKREGYTIAAGGNVVDEEWEDEVND